VNLCTPTIIRKQCQQTMCDRPCLRGYASPPCPTLLRGEQGATGPAFSLPVGTILLFAGSTVPAGFLQCDGMPHQNSIFTALYNVIFNTYGGGLDTFNVPSLTSPLVDALGGPVGLYVIKY